MSAENPELPEIKWPTQAHRPEHWFPGNDPSVSESMVPYYEKDYRVNFVQIHYALDDENDGLNEAPVTHYKPQRKYERFSNSRIEEQEEAKTLKHEALIWADKQRLCLRGSPRADINTEDIYLRVISLYKIYMNAEAAQPEAKLMVQLAKEAARFALQMEKMGIATAILPERIARAGHDYYDGTILGDIISKEFVDLPSDSRINTNKQRRPGDPTGYKTIIELRDANGDIIPGLREPEYTAW